MVLIIIFFNDIYIRYVRNINKWWNSLFGENGKWKKLHAKAQKNYRLRKSQKDPQYESKLNEYMKNYNEKKQNKYAVIKK